MLRKPRPLIPGDRIAVIAPSSPFDEAHLEHGLSWLHAHGFTPVLGTHARRRHRYLAGHDAERAQDLQAALTDPSISGIICARGGYGAARLLPLLDANAIAPHCKLFCGFSDVTALHLWLHARCGWVTFHGPMVGTRWAGEGFDAPTAAAFLSVLQGQPAAIAAPDSVPLRDGTARGRLIGGNLTLLCHSIGTDFEPDTEGSILLIEDVHEAPYRIDRMLTHLRLAGKLRGVAAVVVGELDDCDPPTGTDYAIDDVLADCLGDLSVPVITRFPISHARTNHAVALGVEHVLDTGARRLTPVEAAFSP